jgi:membrane-associated protein
VINPAQLLNDASAISALIIIGLVIFSEAGLLIGVLLPGDTLLIPAGLLAAQGKLSLVGVLLVAWICSVLGSEVGYYMGKKAGKRLFRKQNGVLLRHGYLAKARKFYTKHGGKTIVIARFLPFVRTCAPLVAGATKMNHRTFLLFNIIGGGLWVSITVLASYWFGSIIPNIGDYILPITALILICALAPAFYRLARGQRSGRRHI